MRDAKPAGTRIVPNGASPPDVLKPGDPGFTETAAIFNAGAQTVPALIVRCASTEDVQAGLRHARDHGLPVTARAGGHSVGGFGCVQGGVVLDLRPLASLRRDGAVLHVGAGCRWADLLGGATGTPGAFDPRVGVAGFVLGGGYGMLTRLHGLGADQLVAAEVVLADGTVAEADADLLWALRGAGPNFGVVTRLTLAQHALRPLTVAQLVFPLKQARTVLQRHRDFTAAASDDTTLYLGLDGEGGVQLLGFHFGDGDPFAALEAWGRPLRAERFQLPYADAHAANLETFPEGHHHAWRSHFLGAVPVDALAAFADEAKGHPVWAVLEHLGGAMGRVAPDATAFPHRGAAFGFVSAVKWKSHRPDATLALQARLHAALAPSSLGTYVNYLGAAPTETDIAAAHGSNLPRLRALKQRYDPTNVFRHNANVFPHL